MLRGLNRSRRVPFASRATVQRLAFATNSTEGEKEGLRRNVQIYEAPLASSIKSLKRVSVTTALLSLAIPPAVIFGGSENVPISGQIAITAVTLLASLGSTSAIHYLFSPYILSMSHVCGEAASEESESVVPELNNDSVLEAKTLTLLGGEQANLIHIKDVPPGGIKKSMRPFVNFATSSGKPYFVHASVFENKRLLSRLLGRPLRDDEK
mmetsp:Transcript_46273/g.93401  ORF Transcript_46273/g.93401 Transcript_46273/m.93401 type:complete len:210 (-) Transcript_46273:272-901(-)